MRVKLGTVAVMNVVLTLEAERLVNEKLSSGEYRTPAEVVEDALQLLKISDDQDYREAVEGIRRGLAEAEQGLARPAEDFFDQMRRKHDIPR